jgi:hypothetical protein
MVSLISSLIAEIFLQNYEDTHIKQFLKSKNRAFYVRYVDDTLVVFDKTKINSHTINTYINNIHNNITHNNRTHNNITHNITHNTITHNNITLNHTHEEHSSTDFLDLTILHQHTKLQIDTYRKPTTTDKRLTLSLIIP